MMGSENFKIIYYLYCQLSDGLKKYSYVFNLNNFSFIWKSAYTCTMYLPDIYNGGTYGYDYFCNTFV